MSFSLLDVVIDVDDVKFVINFDYPNCSEDYVHRIGRTGRSQRTGTAYTFFTPNNSKQAQDLVNVLTEANQVVNPKLYELASSSRGSGGRGGNLSLLFNVCNLINNCFVRRTQPLGRWWWRVWR